MCNFSTQILKYLKYFTILFFKLAFINKNLGQCSSRIKPICVHITHRYRQLKSDHHAHNKLFSYRTIYLVPVTQTKQEFIGKTKYTKYFKANSVWSCTCRIQNCNICSYRNSEKAYRHLLWLPSYKTAITAHGSRMSAYHLCNVHLH